jgi:hypothetical protein
MVEHRVKGSLEESLRDQGAPRTAELTAAATSAS